MFFNFVNPKSPFPLPSMAFGQCIWNFHASNWLLFNCIISMSRLSYSFLLCILLHCAESEKFMEQWLSSLWSSWHPGLAGDYIWYFSCCFCKQFYILYIVEETKIKKKKKVRKKKKEKRKKEKRICSLKFLLERIGSYE